jgi:hypothetical protein
VFAAAVILNAALFWNLNNNLVLLNVFIDHPMVINFVSAVDFFVIACAAVSSIAFTDLRRSGIFQELYLAGFSWGEIIGALTRGTLLLLLLDAAIEIPLDNFFFKDSFFGRIIQLISMGIIGAAVACVTATGIVYLNTLMKSGGLGGLVLHIAAIWITYAACIFLIGQLHDAVQQYAFRNINYVMHPVSELLNLLARIPGSSRYMAAKWFADIAVALAIGCIAIPISFTLKRSATHCAPRLLES